MDLTRLDGPRFNVKAGVGSPSIVAGKSGV